MEDESQSQNAMDQWKKIADLAKMEAIAATKKMEWAWKEMEYMKGDNVNMKEELEKLIKQVDMLRNKFTKCTKDAEDAKADSEACKSVGKDLQEKVGQVMKEAMNKTMNATLAPAPMRFIDPVILASQMFDKPVPPAASSKEPTPSTHMAEEVSVDELVSNAMDGLRKAQHKASKIVGAADAHSSALDHE